MENETIVIPVTGGETPQVRLNMGITRAEIMLRALGAIERALGDALGDLLGGYVVPGYVTSESGCPETDDERVPGLIEGLPPGEPLEALTIDLAITVALRPRWKPPQAHPLVLAALAGADLTDPF